MSTPIRSEDIIIRNNPTNETGQNDPEFDRVFEEVVAEKKEEDKIESPINHEQTYALILGRETLFNHQTWQPNSLSLGDQMASIIQEATEIIQKANNNSDDLIIKFTSMDLSIQYKETQSGIQINVISHDETLSDLFNKKAIQNQLNLQLKQRLEIDNLALEFTSGATKQNNQDQNEKRDSHQQEKETRDHDD